MEPNQTSDQLVDQVTKAIMERLGAVGDAAGVTVVTFGDVPAHIMGPSVAVRPGRTPADVEGAPYIILTQAAFRTFHGGAAPAGPALAAPAKGCDSSGAVDLTGKKVVTDRDVRSLGLTSGSAVRVGAKALVTALARDYVNGVGAKIVR